MTEEQEAIDQALDDLEVQDIDELKVIVMNTEMYELLGKQLEPVFNKHDVDVVLVDQVPHLSKDMEENMDKFLGGLELNQEEFKPESAIVIADKQDMQREISSRNGKGRHKGNRW